MLQQQTKHVCSYCGKSFGKKKLWYEHECICEIVHCPTIEKQETQDEEDKVEISQQTLYNVLKIVIQKQKQQENEIKELKKHISVKININDWLNDNLKPTLSKNEMINTFVTLEPLVDGDNKDLKYLFEHSAIQDSIKNILERNIEKYKSTYPKQSDWPIFVYNDKIYLYEINKWIEVTTSLSNKIWSTISNKFLQILTEWKTYLIANYSDYCSKINAQNPMQIIYTKDDLDNIFNSTLLKLIDTTKINTYCKVIKLILIEKIKMNISPTSITFV